MNAKTRNQPVKQEQGEAKLPAEQQSGEPTRSRPTFRPRVDIYETDQGLVLLADVPGATPDGINISLERRELILRAAVVEDAPDNMSALYREYQVGDYERRFQLSGDFDTDNIQAKLADGVLTLTIPKAAQVQAKQITVQAS